jgi:hypothetical protein
METTRSSSSSKAWVERGRRLQLLGIVYAVGVFVVVAVGWVSIEMILPNITLMAQVSSALFLVGAISGGFSVAASFLAEEQQRFPTTQPGWKYDLRSGRVVAVALLVTSCLAMAGAVACLML